MMANKSNRYKIKRRPAIILAVIACMLAASCLAGCGNASVYSINLLSDGDGMVSTCPDKAQAGETVEIETYSATDGDLYVTVDGSRDNAERVQEGLYRFTMPEHDVDVKVWFEGNGLA